jgi:hypothetical protein
LQQARKLRFENSALAIIYTEWLPPMSQHNSKRRDYNCNAELGNQHFTKSFSLGLQMFPISYSGKRTTEDYGRESSSEEPPFKRMKRSREEVAIANPLENNDLILQILSFLPLKDLNAISLTSKKFYHLSYDSHYWQMLCHRSGIDTRYCALLGKASSWRCKFFSATERGNFNALFTLAHEQKWFSLQAALDTINGLVSRCLESIALWKKLTFEQTAIILLSLEMKTPLERAIPDFILFQFLQDIQSSPDCLAEEKCRTALLQAKMRTLKATYLLDDEGAAQHFLFVSRHQSAFPKERIEADYWRAYLRCHQRISSITDATAAQLLANVSQNQEVSEALSGRADFYRASLRYHCRISSI